MVHFIIGTEAELIKIFPIMMELKERKIKYNFISTGQHKIKDSQVLNYFKLQKPNVVLYDGPEFTSIIKMGFWFCSTILYSVFNKNKIFKGDKKGYSIVHGDAISTLLGTVISKISGMKVIHVEAGIRSGNLINPFPEEITRSIVSLLSDIDFCTGIQSCRNLRKYKFKKRIVNIYENTLFDSFNLVMKEKKPVNRIKGKYFIFILHRTENLLNKKLVEELIKYVKVASKKITCLYIVHPTSKFTLQKYKLWKYLQNDKNIHVYDRLSYNNFMSYLSKAEFICTDGGGNQQECTYLGMPILTLRTLADSHEGLGKNVVVSKFNFKIIDNFFNNYKKYKTAPLIVKKSPTKIIIEELVKQKIIQ